MASENSQIEFQISFDYKAAKLHGGWWKQFFFYFLLNLLLAIIELYVDNNSSQSTIIQKMFIDW